MTAEETGELAGALVRVRSNIERVEKEITCLKNSQISKIEELKRKRDEEIENIEARFRTDEAATSLYSKEKIIEKENEKVELESVQKEMKSKLLQSLAIPIPDKAIPECLSGPDEASYADIQLSQRSPHLQ